MPETLGSGIQDKTDFDPAPVLKLFTPDTGATWLLTEIDPEERDHLKPKSVRPDKKRKPS